MKVTKHNGRSGKHGAYNPKHNDRQFDVEKSEHIDAERMLDNVYWDYQRGYRYATQGNKDGISFEKIELDYYSQAYGGYIENQNARYVKNRHPERQRTVEDLYKNDKTCPEESIYQIGNIDESTSAETLRLVVEEYFEEWQEQFGTYIKILDWSLHCDEATPHIHERHVFECKNEYGELCPQQEKALEKLGIPFPDPKKPKGRRNNRKVTYDAMCRDMLLTICKRYGIEVDEVPVYGGQKYLEKNDYIIQKQHKEINENEEELKETKKEIKESKKELKATRKQVADEQEELEATQEECREADAELAMTKHEVYVEKKRLKAIGEIAEEADEIVGAMCDIAYDVVFEEVATTVANQVKSENADTTRDGYMELMDAELPQPIRSQVAKVMLRIIDAIDKPIREIVDNIKIYFKRDCTEDLKKEKMQEQMWHYLENKAEYDQMKGLEESLANQFVRNRRRGR